MASAFRSSRVDFIPADDVLEKNFGDENSVKVMYNANESDIDWQLENWARNRGKRSTQAFASVRESDAIEHMVLKCEDILLRLPFLRLICRLVLEY